MFTLGRRRRWSRPRWRTELAVLEGFASVLSRAQEGCGDSVAAIYRAFHPPLLRFLRFQEPSEAEDLAATVWMTVARTIGGFEGDDRAFRAWMFTIARRRLVDLRRSRARRQTVPVASFEESGQADPRSFEAEHAGGDSLRRALGSLSEAQAEVVALRVVCDLSVDEVASLVGRTPEAVRQLQHRALRRLATTLDPSSSSEAVTA